ncbi:MAG: hypothetical protein GY809_31250 [Planctomycetes bacterium]|nr:hypothetical protein [Planctomycetota bacterium]
MTVALKEAYYACQSEVFYLSQEKNLIDLPEHTQLITQLHARFWKHNDHNKMTRDPRTTEAFRVTR